MSPWSRGDGRHRRQLAGLDLAIGELVSRHFVPCPLRNLPLRTRKLPVRTRKINMFLFLRQVCYAICNICICMDYILQIVIIQNNQK